MRTKKPTYLQTKRTVCGASVESLPDDRRDPWWTHGQYALGCVYLKKGAYPDARRAFETCAFFLDDGDVEMTENIARSLATIERSLGRRHDQPQ
jgi:hypothetical protein